MDLQGIKQTKLYESRKHFKKTKGLKVDNSSEAKLI